MKEYKIIVSNINGDSSKEGTLELREGYAYIKLDGSSIKTAYNDILNISMNKYHQLMLSTNDYDYILESDQINIIFDFLQSKINNSSISSTDDEQITISPEHDEVTKNVNNVSRTSDGLKFLYGLIIVGIGIFTIFTVVNIIDATGLNKDRNVAFHYEYTGIGLFSVEACNRASDNKDLVNLVVDFDVYDDNYKIAEVIKIDFGTVRQGRCITKDGYAKTNVQKVNPKSIKYSLK